MDATASVGKSREELWHWSQTDPRGLVDFTFELQAEVRRLRDTTAQNSRNSSRPPSTDRPEKPKPKSLLIREMCAEMFGYAVSEGTLQAARQEQHQALEPFEERLRQILPREPVLHADETSLPINKTKYWLHVLCTPLLTFFAVQLHRGREAIQAIGIIPQFKGWLMHDFLSSYLGFENCVHTFCKSHLLRELIFLFEEHQQQWAEDLHDLFLEMLRWVQKRKARDALVTEAQFRTWERQYLKVLRAGRRANPRTSEQSVFAAGLRKRDDVVGFWDSTGILRR